MSTGGDVLGRVSEFGRGFVTGSRETLNAATGSSYFLPVIIGFIGLTVIIILGFAFYQYKKHMPTVALKGPVDLFRPQSPVVVPRPTTTTTMKGSYTMAFYMRIDALPDMRSGGVDLLTWPGIWTLKYNPGQEELQWVFKVTQESPDAPAPETIVQPRVPAQRWNQVVIAFEGRTLDLYLNGTLIKSDTLGNVPPASRASITIVPEMIMGQIAMVQLWSRRLTVAEVASNYTDTSDSQGRPFLGPDFFKALSTIQSPNLFCPGGVCSGSTPVATPSQKWEFPYA
jgi:hypothetical protein